MESNEIHHTGEGHSTGTSRFNELQALVAKMAPDFEKFYKDGNKAAGTRVRNAMQELKTFAQMIRTEVQSIKNAGQTGAAASPEKED
jgi:N-acetylglucosamine kinase-like BadF-type ATPase